MLRPAVAAAVFAGTIALASPARAWYFPEHVVIAKDATAELPGELREILHAAAERARAEGLSLCSGVDVGLDDLSATTPLRTPMLHSDVGIGCVPFAALAALAADHADGAADLRALLASKKGLELTTAAAYEWRRFLDAVARHASEGLQRMSFVHELDVDFYFIDPGYEVRAAATRAHFVDAGRSLDDVVRGAAVAGAVDNAVGQFVGHHFRSLELAARGDAAGALLEHGFAIHFLEDAFSAGHLVMTGWSWARGNDHVRRRHDFFDAAGIRVRRALATEPCAALALSFEPDLTPCWTTTGDGSLAVAPDGTDRVHVVRAVKKAELELALALDADRVLRFVDGLDEREQIAFAELLDPAPWWTLPRPRRWPHVSTAAHALRVVRGAARAAAALRALPLTPAIAVGRPAPGLFDGAIVDDALEPCGPAEPDDAPRDEDGCGASRALRLGSIGTSLLRPLLVELPAAQEDVSRLEGEAAIAHGVAFQLLASLGTSGLFHPRSPAQIYAPALGVSAGLAYRFGNYLPGRRNRAAVEVNAGLSSAIQVDTRGEAGGNPLVTMFEQEVRWPILWEILTSYALPLNLRQTHHAGSVIAIGGARVRELLTPAPRIWGIEHELIAVALSSGGGAYPLYSASPELRFYFGFAAPDATHPGAPSTWGPVLSVTLTGGYATFF